MPPPTPSGAPAPLDNRLLVPGDAKQVANLSAMGHRREARQTLKHLAGLPCEDPAALEALGFVAFGLGEHAVAQGCYERFTHKVPGDSLGWYNLATAHRNMGALEAAEAACDRALDLEPALAQAALLRAHARTQSSERNHVDALRHSLESVAPAGTEALFFHYALGKELEDVEDYRTAFAHYSRGAALRRASLRYSVDEDVAKLQRIMEAFSSRRIAVASPLEPARDHGFSLGLPRSGTTLVERVLTGNPMVASNGETDLLLGALMAGTPASGGDIFERVARADPGAVAAAYFRLAGPLPPDRVVLEKLPMNYLYAGAIRLTLPAARIILVERSPLDNCFAMFSTLFGAGYPFSYDFDDLATYHAAYTRLVDHWRRLLGDQLIVLPYEEFVSEPQRYGEMAASHFGIDWSPSMTAIETNRSATATASAAQVRRPIYKSAINRAAKFAADLEPLRDRLAASAEGAA